jgi:hypothetical protein
MIPATVCERSDPLGIRLDLLNGLRELQHPLADCLHSSRSRDSAQFRLQQPLLLSLDMRGRKFDLPPKRARTFRL